MNDEKFEQLINYAITDGQLTEKEKQVLIKKANELGLDLDEFEVILDAKLFERKQELFSKTQNQTNSNSNKFGEIRKCPSCGAQVKSFNHNCDHCGHEYINVETNSSIEKLFRMLNEMEDSRKEDSITSNPFKAIGKFYANAFSGMTGPSKIDRKKMEIIANFPIPNTKNDIFEFLSLAIPKAKQMGNMFTKLNPENKSHNDFLPVWKTKCEQIIIKGKLIMKDDKQSLEELLHYAKEIGIRIKK